MRFLFDSRLAAISLVAAFLLPVPALAGSQLLKEVPAATFNPRSEPADVALLAGAAQVASQQQGWVWDGNSGKQMYNISKQEGSRILQLTLQVDASGYRLRHLQSQGFDLKQADAERKTAKELEDACRFNLLCLAGVPAKLKQAEGGKVDVIDEAYYGWVTPLARQLQLAGNAALAQTWADVFAANLLRSDGELITFPILEKAAQVAAPRLGWQLLPPAQPGTVRLTRSEGGRSATVQLAASGASRSLARDDVCVFGGGWEGGWWAPRPGEEKREGGVRVLFFCEKKKRVDSSVLQTRATHGADGTSLQVQLNHGTKERWGGGAQQRTGGKQD